MTLSLPQVIIDYLARPEGGDPAPYFTKDAKVIDERRTFGGHDDIRAWKAETDAKYHPRTEPLRFVETDGTIVVTARVSGTFPGSPAELDYAFTLRDGLIATLAIS